MAPVALAVMAISGCGASGDPPAHPRAALHAANEHRLLALLERARTEVAAHNNVDVDATLSRFITEVNSLRASSELTTSTAAALDRQALATEVQAARQLQPGISQSDATVDLARDVQTTTTGSTPARPPDRQAAPQRPPATTGPAGGPPGQTACPDRQARPDRQMAIPITGGMAGRTTAATAGATGVAGPHRRETPIPDQATKRLTAGDQITARYRLEAVAGTGGMATVWRAHDELLQRPVAIKVMSDTLAANAAAVRRFAREARTHANIQHPNLVQVYDYSATAPQPYLVMEYIDGATLSQRLDRDGFSATAIQTLARELLSALACVHDHGVLHRDIKPANILLGDDNRARLTDFGLARLDESTADHTAR